VHSLHGRSTLGNPCPRDAPGGCLFCAIALAAVKFKFALKCGLVHVSRARDDEGLLRSGAGSPVPARLNPPPSARRIAGSSCAAKQGAVPVTIHVLGLQVTEASLKDLAASTRDGLHTSITGKAPARAALLQLRSSDQLELDALNKYRRACPGPH